MPTTTVFSQIISTENVEDAVLSTVQLWADTYLSEVERQNGLPVPTLGRPASYQADYDTENSLQWQLPGVVIVCPGPTGKLERQGDMQYGGWFEVGVAVVVSGLTQKDARNTAQRYQAAMNALCLQQGDFGGFATLTVLNTFEVELHERDNRYVALATSEFQVFVDGIVTASAGPILPDPTELTPDPNAPPGSTQSPYSGYGEVESAEINLTEST